MVLSTRMANRAPKNVQMESGMAVMELGLLVLYGCVLILQIALLVSGMRAPTPNRWKILYTVEVVSLIAAAGLAVYYNQRLGTGTMPGITYFAEMFYSLGAAVVFGGMMLGSVLIRMVTGKKG